MILCVNANAAIDKTLVVPGFRLNEIQRPERVLAIPGGKGINVARALQRLGETPVVTGWVGGYAGEFIEQGLHREGVQTDFVHTESESRTCLSILDPGSHTLTELYEKGEPVSPASLEEFKSLFRATVDNYAAVTFSGSLPPGVLPGLYGELIEIARARGVPGFLDSSGEALVQGLTCGKPVLVKPNRKELADLVGDAPGTLQELARDAMKLAAQYQTRVVISLGAQGAVATDGKQVLQVQPPQVVTSSAVGSGDCMLAGITYGLTRSMPFEEAIQYGVAAGTANAMTIGAGNFSRHDFERVLQATTTRPIQYST